MLPIEVVNVHCNKIMWGLLVYCSCSSNRECHVVFHKMLNYCCGRFCTFTNVYCVITSLEHILHIYIFNSIIKILNINYCYSCSCPLKALQIHSLDSHYKHNNHYLQVPLFSILFSFLDLHIISSYLSQTSVKHKFIKYFMDNI